jgi:flagellar assembly protein FliH
MMIGEAKSGAEGIRASARAEGYASGRKDAEAEAVARKNEESKELQRMVEKLKGDYSGLVDGVENDLISLVIEITKKIIGVKLKESDKVFFGMVNDAIERLKRTGYLIIRISPEDYARYFGSDAADGNIETGEAKVVVIEEDGFSSGDLIIESEGEMLDLSINRQIEKVEKAFSEEGS